MSPNTLAPNDILTDDSYFMWEFNARMKLARKDLLDHVLIKPEPAVLRENPGWKVADMKALAVLVKLISSTYQCMVRECESAFEAWEVLKTFFAKKNLHNRVQLRKELHEFVMETGASLMDHLLKFDELCLKLGAAGDSMDDDEKLVLLLGSLSSEYDDMVRIIEAHSNVTLLDAKEMLRREYDTLQKRDKKETAFTAHAQRNEPRRFQSNRGHRGQEENRDRYQTSRKGKAHATVIKRVGKLFAWNVKQHITLEAHKAESSGAINDTSGLWHARLGHVSTKKIMQAMKSCDGISRVVASDGGVCDGCARGKMTNSPFSHISGSEVKTSRPLEVIHIDLMGPMNPKSKGGALYVLTFIDDYSRFVYVYLLAAKSQVFERFKAFRAMVEKQTDCKIKCIRSDNGGEYTNHRFNKYCADLGIIH
ncbi:unnamed protein product [Peronospora farinosa]|uniref:Integrase catalytic domain-containing protein n=1 Tax=Peronospora farinosa TaxID=134698 RepID=A0AAV0SWZ3_9STRA|nr:unnamed protein product [Peronospora farinosa]